MPSEFLYWIWDEPACIHRCVSYWLIEATISPLNQISFSWKIWPNLYIHGKHRLYLRWWYVSIDGQVRGRDIIYYDSEGKQISFTEAIYNMVYWVAHCTPSSTRHLAEHPYTSTSTNTNTQTQTQIHSNTSRYHWERQFIMQCIGAPSLWMHHSFTLHIIN